MLYGCSFATPLELLTDGDLLILLRRMLDLRGRDTVRVTKVKGHADEGMVLDGRVREIDRLGNNAADEAADFGRRRVGNAVIDARRLLLLILMMSLSGPTLLVFWLSGFLSLVLCIGLFMVGILVWGVFLMSSFSHSLRALGRREASP